MDYSPREVQTEKGQRSESVQTLNGEPEAVDVKDLHVVKIEPQDMVTRNSTEDNYLKTIADAMAASSASEDINNRGIICHNPVLHEQETAKETSASHKTPKQDVIQKEIVEIQHMLMRFNQMNNSGILTPGEINNMMSLRNRLKVLKQKHSRLKAEAERQRRRRRELKNKLFMLANDHPSLQNFARGKRGRPSLETDKPELLCVIKDLALGAGAVDDRPHSGYFQSSRTLDQLTEELHQQGFHISRAATYLRLIPRQSDTEHGKRHVSTVPVKLMRAPKTRHESHVDTDFTLATISYVKDLCSWFGPKTCSFLSMDHKARVPIGLTSVPNEDVDGVQMEDHVELFEQDSTAVETLNLMLSVYASCAISNNMLQSAVTYSGPTYITIRDEKHDRSTICTHARDFEHLLELESFKAVMCYETGELKPILVCNIDSGPDENPRLPKPLQVACNRFREHNLDVYLALTQAPGFSMYNHLERRLAILCRDLSELALPSDSFESHHHSSGDTNDSELEVQYIKKAGETLAERWSGSLLDSYNVTAEYLEAGDKSTGELDSVSPKWVANHVRQSQYLLQIIKCDDGTCCMEWRTNWNEIVPTRFLPAPFPLQRSQNGLTVPEPEDADDCNLYASLSQRLAFTVRPAAARDLREIPFDMYCPSVRADIRKRLCCTCGIYFASQEVLKQHIVIHDDTGTDLRQLVNKKGDSANICDSPDEPSV